MITVERTRQIAPPSSRDPDGQHCAQGHAAVAAHLLPQVMSAVGEGSCRGFVGWAKGAAGAVPTRVCGWG